jgi:hypothetical protein
LALVSETPRECFTAFAFIDALSCSIPILTIDPAQH